MSQFHYVSVPRSLADGNFYTENRIWPQRTQRGGAAATERDCAESQSQHDGWNLAAVLDSANTLLYSFRRGTDLSGTMQGAGGVGGVGGLISMTVHTGGNAGTYFYAFDGNGKRGSDDQRDDRQPRRPL